MALTFSDVKIEKLLGLPKEAIPNRFYLVETGGTTEFYLSDSKGNLHLLNEGYHRELNINIVSDYNVLATDDRMVFNNIGAGQTVIFYLPIIEDNLEFSFFVHTDDMRISATGGETMYLGDAPVASNEVLTSTYTGSFICIRAINGMWVARYMTGQWDIELITYIDGGSETSEYTQIIDGGDVLAEYTNIIDGGTP